VSRDPIGVIALDSLDRLLQRCVLIFEVMQLRSLTLQVCLRLGVKNAQLAVSAE